MTMFPEHYFRFDQLPTGHRDNPISLDSTLETHADWQPFRASDFASGTIGDRILKNIDQVYASGRGGHFLEGRRRAAALFDRKLTDLWTGKVPEQFSTYYQPDISIREFMSQAVDDRYTHIQTEAPTVELMVGTYLFNLAVAPAVHLAYQLLDPEKEETRPRPITIQGEELLQDEIDQLMRRVSVDIPNAPRLRRTQDSVDRGLEMLSLRYGLKTGMPETLAKIGKLFDVTPRVVHETLYFIERYMRNRIRKEQLQQLLEINA